MAAMPQGRVASLPMDKASATTSPDFGELEQHRAELTAYCYRMLGSPFDAEDAVQDTFVRAWRALDRFEERASLRSWLYRIATNVCLDMLKSPQGRARPMGLGPAQAPLEEDLPTAPAAASPESLPDPPDAAVATDTLRRACAAPPPHLP